MARYDTVTYNDKCIFCFHPHSWLRDPKNLWNFLGDESDKGVFCYILPSNSGEGRRLETGFSHRWPAISSVLRG